MLELMTQIVDIAAGNSDSAVTLPLGRDVWLLAVLVVPPFSGAPISVGRNCVTAMRHVIWVRCAAGSAMLMTLFCRVLGWMPGQAELVRLCPLDGTLLKATGC